MRSAGDAGRSGVLMVKRRSSMGERGEWDPLAEPRVHPDIITWGYSEGLPSMVLDTPSGSEADFRAFVLQRADTHRELQDLDTLLKQAAVAQQRARCDERTHIYMGMHRSHRASAPLCRLCFHSCACA